MNLQKACRHTIVLSLGIMLLLPYKSSAATKPSAAQLSAITTRGRLLAEYDAAVADATDAVLATHPPEDSSHTYIAHPSDGGWIVDFGTLSPAEDRFLVSYQAVRSGGSKEFHVTRLEPPREDTAWDLSAAKSMNAALADFQGVDHPYNIAVLPSDSNSLFVYLYPAQARADEYPLGADIRYHFASDGALIEKRQLHKGLIAQGAVAEGTQAIAGFHTHILSNLPEDTDVFVVLARRPRKPEYIDAGSFTYLVQTDGKIIIVDRR